MGFVDGQQVEGADFIHQTAERRVSRDGHPTLALPLLQLVIPVAPMDDDGIELRVLLHLALPVDEHAVWCDHEEVFLSLGRQVTHCRQHLDRLTQAHVVTQEHALLADDILGAELLVASQVSGQQTKVHLGGLDGIGDLRRQSTAHVRTRQRSLRHHPGRQHALEQCDERRGIPRITPPRLA